MGDYADTKRRKMLKLLKWLETQSGFSVTNGGHHQWLVKHESWLRPFPIPFKHETVNKYIVKDLMNRIVATNICTREEFDQHIK